MADATTAIELSGIAAALKLSVEQVRKTLELLDAGNSIPFITRYRKEQTGNLDETQILEIQDRVRLARQLAERAEDVLRLIEAQGKLTGELRRQILAADSLKRLDDLYLPFRPKKRTRASAARERGLDPLAAQVWEGALNEAALKARAASFVDPGKELADVEAVLQGVHDILAERIGEEAMLRERCRKLAWEGGRLSSAATKGAAQTHQEFRDYFDYGEPLSRMPPHRVLALNRGEEAGALRVKFEWDAARALESARHILRLDRHPAQAILERAAEDAIGRFLEPSIEREVRRDLTERAQKHAIDVFARNLRQLLLQPPVQGRRVLAIDPGYRTGCKIAALDESGSILALDVLTIIGSQEKRNETRRRLIEIIDQCECRVVAIGNGTACRESEELVAEIISTDRPDLSYVVVNEAGASIYSASAVAREEFPQLDATARGTISIGRRLQDPLSELVKIEPQHIGVGMYQHDLPAKQLKEVLDRVVESCVNFVGVDLNRSSASLLAHVSGFNQLVARRVVEYRSQHGPFRSRKQLLDVPGIGPGTFTQAAGFLKLTGEEPLDNTWIHPESYDVARRLLARVGLKAADLSPGAEHSEQLRERLAGASVTELAGELGVGEPTLRDIVEALQRPGRDPRTDLPPPMFRKGVLSLDDIEVGMELQGTVLNVVDFGAFVDVGLKDSALIHISQMSTRFVKSPQEVVSVGDVVKTWVLNVDRERRRIGLSLISPDGASTPPAGNAEKPAAKPAANRQPAPSRPKADRPAPAAGQPLSGFDQLKQAWNARPDR